METLPASTFAALASRVGPKRTASPMNHTSKQITPTATEIAQAFQRIGGSQNSSRVSLKPAVWSQLGLGARAFQNLLGVGVFSRKQEADIALPKLPCCGQLHSDQLRYSQILTSSAKHSFYIEAGESRI